MIDLAVVVATSLAKRFEGCYLRPYLCPAGIPTIGFGATYYEDGTRVTLHDSAITIERAEELLNWMVRTVYLPAVIILCPSITDSNRLAAIIDFTFNLGTGKLKASTLRKRINVDQWGDVKIELMKWTKAAGRELKGLKLRRIAECQLC